MSWVFSKMSRMFLMLPLDVPRYEPIFSCEMSPGFCKARNLNRRLACVWLSVVIEEMVPISCEMTFLIISVIFLQMILWLSSKSAVGNPPYFRYSSQSVVEQFSRLIKSRLIACSLVIASPTSPSKINFLREVETSAASYPYFSFRC